MPLCNSNDSKKLFNFTGDHEFKLRKFGKSFRAMEQRALRNVNNCLYTIVYSYLETSCGISYNSYLNVVHFFNTRVN
jgi:hypothetical protein